MLTTIKVYAYYICIQNLQKQTMQMFKQVGTSRVRRFGIRLRPGPFLGPFLHSV